MALDGIHFNFKKRRLLFRGTAILLPLALYVTAECLCRFFMDTRPAVFHDPFVEFESNRPLFRLQSEGTRFVTSEDRLSFFVSDGFNAEKAANEFRVFCLGGSTVQGRPYSIETSFTTWLEIALNTCFPSKTWEVINAGGVSYASYRVVPIFEECLEYEPDLILLCMGHNEFLEDRSYDGIRSMPKSLRLAGSWMMKSRLAQFLAIQAASDHEKAVLPAEVDALLDYQHGIEAYQRDPVWREQVIEHFRLNVKGMIDRGRAAGVPVLIILPPSNLEDCPPFKSQHRDDLTTEDLEAFIRLVETARSQVEGNVFQGIETLKRAVQIDDQFAETQFTLAKWLQMSGNIPGARAAFIRARDEDVCPLRILSPMENRLRELAAESNTPFLDAHSLLEERTPSGILGNDELVDHVHPSIEGHQKIALALLKTVAELAYADTNKIEESRIRKAFSDHFASLPKVYFFQAESRLIGLTKWTQGRASGPDIRTK